MPARDIVIRLAAGTGEGIQVAGEILAVAAVRTGWDVFTFRTYPAEIRGGPSYFQLRLGRIPILSQGGDPDIMVVFDEDSYIAHLHHIKPGGLVIYDSDSMPKVKGVPGIELIGVPFSSLAGKVGFPRARNMVALGALSAAFGIPMDKLEGSISERFGDRGEEIVGRNIAASRLGFSFVMDLGKAPFYRVSPPGPKVEERILITGYQAIALGAYAAGCNFLAAYPITPATPIMEELSRLLLPSGGIVLQMEDEISAIGAAIGASYAGALAMTATSGPGFSLMTEMIGLASMAEIPLVIVDAQRAGPSTGMPTKTEQSDLNAAIYGGHGEAPRIVLAPGTIADCFYMTARAFYLAERYQMPVIIMADMAIIQRMTTVPAFRMDRIPVPERIRARPGSTKRYAMTDSGISPMPIPGDRGLSYIATGLEHDEYGNPSYDPAMHEAMTSKRWRKLKGALDQLIPPVRYGILDPEIGVIGWGSTEGAIKEGVDMAIDHGIKASSLHIKSLYPLHLNEIRRYITQPSLKAVIVPELNFTGQLADLIESKMGIAPIKLTKAQGLPFSPQEIFEEIKRVDEEMKV